MLKLHVTTRWGQVISCVWKMGGGGHWHKLTNIFALYKCPAVLFMCNVHTFYSIELYVIELNYEDIQLYILNILQMVQTFITLPSGWIFSSLKSKSKENRSPARCITIDLNHIAWVRFFPDKHRGRSDPLCTPPHPNPNPSHPHSTTIHLPQPPTTQPKPPNPMYTLYTCL